MQALFAHPESVMKSRRQIWFALALTFTLTALFPEWASAQNTEKLKHVTLLNYSVAADMGDAPLWIVPHALGYFADEELDVGIQQSGGSAAALQLLAAGRGEFATSVPDQLMLAVQRGLPIKSFFEHNRTYGSALVVLSTSGVKTIAELKKYLKGSAIGVASLSSGRVPYAREWIRQLGLKEDTDVKLVAVGVGPQAAAALKSDRVRALVIYDAVYAAIEAGSDIHFTRFELDFQKPLFSGIITTTDELLQKDPDLAVRMGRAVAKALIFSSTNPEAVVRIFWKLYPENKPTGDDAAALKSSTTIVNSMVKNWTAGIETPNSRVGSQSTEQWQHIQDVAASAGMIPKKLPVSDYFTDTLSEKINNFDRATIVKQAHEFNEGMIRYGNAR
jgi:NitT/TauT family transport system substrate-binding protein